MRSGALRIHINVLRRPFVRLRITDGKRNSQWRIRCWFRGRHEWHCRVVALRSQISVLRKPFIRLRSTDEERNRDGGEESIVAIAPHPAVIIADTNIKIDRLACAALDEKNIARPPVD